MMHDRWNYDPPPRRLDDATTEKLLRLLVEIDAAKAALAEKFDARRHFKPREEQ